MGGFVLSFNSMKLLNPPYCPEMH